ncbi:MULTISPECIES: FxLYD domain-containing protein [unclassified Streptomyces]|uniref:FxLYD domain-containing protein n=1 Tax=unclassified Streptomyces TaxID=2593676 RepID=UPI0037F61C64
MLAAVVLCLAAVTALTGCSDGDSPSSVASGAASAASRAASAGESAASRAASAAESLASRAPEALASATAEVGRKLDDIKDGADAASDVKTGTPKADGDRSTVEVTATNTDDATRSFAVQVDFTDAGGNLLDTVLVTVPDVGAGGSGTATARSNRDLQGEVKAKVGRAVRY